MSSEMPGSNIVDVIIVGAGPAGLSAAVNAKARNLSAILIAANEPAAKVKAYPEVTNYLGFPKAPGAELSKHFAQHFSKTGFPFIKERAQKIMPLGEDFVVGTDKEVYDGKTVILTFGVAQTKLLPGEEQLLGKGVAYCVTCDGALFSGKDVVVIGYIHEGEEEANALAGFAKSVTYVSTYEKVETLDAGIKLVHAKPVSILGGTKVTGLQTDLGEMPADGVFVIREAVPVGTMLEGIAVQDNFIQVDRSMATNIPGVFAAGDCTGAPFQIAKAVGEGQVAALSAARHVYKLRKKEG